MAEVATVTAEIAKEERIMENKKRGSRTPLLRFVVQFRSNKGTLTGWQQHSHGPCRRPFLFTAGYHPLSAIHP
jgi:hypothetical protein